MKDIEQVHDLTYILDEHIVKGGDSDTYGWTKGTISELSVNEAEGKMIMIIELPWGDTNTYEWSYEEVLDGPLSILCKSYGYSLSELDRLKGEDIWLMVRFLEIDEDGEISGGTRMSHAIAATGPHEWKHSLKLLAKLAAIILLFAFILAVVLL